RVVPRCLYSHWIDGERRTPSPPLGAESVGVRWGIPERLPPPTSPSHASGMGPSLSPLKGGEGLGIYGIIAAVLIFSVGFARADNAPTRADIWSLKLGAPASALPQDAFVDYACGS